MSKLEIKGLEEFQDKLRTIEKKAPDRIIKELDKQGNYLRRETRKNTPKKTGRLRKGFQLTQVEKNNGGYEKSMFNKAPHHHLVNLGHRKVTPGGKEVGWTDGIFYVDKTLKQIENPMMSAMSKWLDELFKELK